MHFPPRGATLLVTSCDSLWHLVTACDILWHLVTFCDILWHLVRSGSSLLHPGLCAHWEDGLNKQPMHSDFSLLHSSLMFLTFLATSTCHHERSGTCWGHCKVNWICRERILPCCRWAWHGLSSRYMARFGPNWRLHTSISHHFCRFLIGFVCFVPFPPWFPKDSVRKGLCSFRMFPNPFV